MARHLVGLLALWLAVVAVNVIWVDPGPMTIDEVTYQRMTHGLLHGDGFFIANGYEELHSRELTSMFIHETDEGKLAAQYPYGGPTIAAPFYAAFGLRGPFLLSALAFALAIWLCHRIAMQLLGDKWVARGAAALLATTYFSEYALGSWPHATAVASAAGAFSLAVAGYQACGRRSLWLCAASGLVAGVGMTLRLDAVLVVPTLAAPFLFTSPTRVRQLIALGAGVVPGAAFVVWTNYERWRAMSPMSYGPTGHDAGMHKGFLLVAFALTVAVWIATRPRVRPWLRQRVRYLLAGALGALVAGFALRSSLREDAVNLFVALHGIFAYVVDLRERPNAGIIFDQTLAVMYANGIKKALLQSSPFLVLAALPVIRAFVRHEHRATIAWLMALPLTLIGFFGMFAWHGGMCLNLRYVLPALPFLCILAALAVRELARVAPRSWPIVTAAVTIAVAVTYLVLYALSLDPEPSQPLVLTVPIAIALATFVAAGIAYRRPTSRTAWIALVLAGAGVGWSIAATIEDARWSRDLRSLNYQVGDCVAERITDGALLIAEVPDPVYSVVLAHPGVHIAVPGMDSLATTHALIEWHLSRGRRVFAVVGPTMWKMLRARGALDGYAVDTIEQVAMFVLGEIRPARPGEPDRGAIVDIDLVGTKGCGRRHLLWPYRFDPRLGPAFVTRAAQ